MYSGDISLNYDVDFFKTAKFKVRNLIGSDKINAVRNLNSKSTPEEKINAYGDMFGIKPEVLKRFIWGREICNSLIC